MFKEYFRENIVKILILILVSLLFILWGRYLAREFRKNTYIKDMSTPRARIGSISAFGWEVDEGSETAASVAIPEEFDAVYIEYNKLQKMSGFDLERYKGKMVERYTYRVLNFPYDIDTDVFVNILVYEGELVGGDCMSVALDGFMLPLDRRFAP